MKAKVYFSREITPEKVVALYRAVGCELPGKVAVKLHSGEQGNQNFLGPDFWRPMIEAVHGTVVECNTAYEGSGTDPSRIFKGTGGPGQMGGETVTIQNLEVVKVDPELNMLVVRGAIPGPKFSLVTVKNTVKTHKVKQAGAGISSNPQKASGRNPQKASARTK